MTIGFACASMLSCAPSPNHVEVTNDVSIIIVPELDALPFDPRGARLRSATDQLTALAGHPIAIQIDAAIASALRPEFEHELIAAIENTARDLAQWKKAEPLAFAESVRTFHRLECHYRATVTEPESSFDAKSGVLRIDLPSHPSSLVPRGAVGDALSQEDDAALDRDFGTKTPDTVSASERRAYYEYLVRTRPGYGSLYERRFRDKTRGLPPAEALASSPRADVIARVARLRELAQGDPDLLARSRRWLFEQLPFFASAYENSEADLDAVRAGSLFRVAESAYVRWLAATWPTASTEERVGAAKSIFKTRYPRAYPGFDRFASGLRLVGEVRARGNNPEDDELRALLNVDRGWLGFALSTEENLRKLAQTLDAHADAGLVESVFLALRGSFSRRDEREGRPDPYPRLLHLLDPSRKAWHAGINVLLDDRDRSLETEAQYIWKTYPAKRGVAVYLLAKDKKHLGPYYGDNYWREFPQSYGAAIDGPMLGAMLDDGRPAFELVPTLWLGLAPRFSRAAVLVPRIDSVLTDATVPDAAGTLRALSAIVDRLCKEGNASDLAALHTYLDKRIASHPREAPPFTILKRDTAPGGCRARTKVADDPESKR